MTMNRPCRDCAEPATEDLILIKDDKATVIPYCQAHYGVRVAERYRELGLDHNAQDKGTT